jgi:hypothetical protein
MNDIPHQDRITRRCHGQIRKESLLAQSFGGDLDMMLGEQSRLAQTPRCNPLPDRLNVGRCW